MKFTLSEKLKFDKMHVNDVGSKNIGPKKRNKFREIGE